MGVETFWRPDRLVREKEWRYKRWHLVLLAKNLAGWHNIIRLTSQAYADMYQSPCVDDELLALHHEGVITTTACVSGPLAYLIQNGTDRQVDAWVDKMLGVFGDDLYFSIMPHAFPLQREINVVVAQIAARVGRPVVHEKDSHYPEKGWEETQKIAILTGINKTFAEADEEARQREAEGLDPYELWHPDLHLSTEEEDREMYALHHPDLSQSTIDEAMASTEEILRKCEPYVVDRSLKMPRVVGEKDSAQALVLRWCREGLKEVGKDGDPVYEERLEYEAMVIGERDAWDYFALIGDLVRWARTDVPLPVTDEDPEPPRKKPIRINVRGSAAASLVCYSTKISTLDPITQKFKFERFMNPERRSMPDIDIDCASSGRQLLKEYIARKYGRSAVADIVAYQHFQPRAALKAVAKTMYGFDSEPFKRVSVLTHEQTGVIDQVNDFDLEVIRSREPELDKWAKDFPAAWEHARRLENAGDPSVLRLSKHAAGVVIMSGQISEVMPTLRADDDDAMPRTAWSETSKVSVVDEIGVVKADLLGLKGLDQQQMIVEAIEAATGEWIDLDHLSSLLDPYDVEPKVMEIFRQGLTLGVNQFSGDGVTDFLKRAAPSNAVDLTAINAIYRPGPLGSGAHNRYIKHRHGEPYDLHPLLQPILEDTYGCLVFQEQVMELFQVLVGYSAGQADDIRKEIDKLNRAKNQEGRQKLAQRRDEFIAAATDKLGSADAAEGIWQWILPYTAYAFNRPHAGSYAAAQAYQDAWLKAHYPLFFYPVCMSLDEEKTLQYLREARNPMFGISVLPPDINVSGDGFTPDVAVNAIRFGLRGIKGIGDAIAEQVLADRPFSSLDDFMERESRKYSKVNKAARQVLIEVGALDCFGARDDWTPRQRAQAEVRLLGVALEPDGILGEDGALVRPNLFTEREVESLPDGSEVIVAGKVIDMNRTRVKKAGKMQGRAMATGIKIVLDLEMFTAVCFPDQWDQYEQLLTEAEMVIVKGTLDSRGSIIIKTAMDLDQYIQERKMNQEVAA